MQSRALTDRIERLAKETGEAAELHQQEETSARKKKAKAEVELAGTVAKYDRDMAVKTTQIDEIKVILKRRMTTGNRPGFFSELGKFAAAFCSIWKLTAVPH